MRWYGEHFNTADSQHYKYLKSYMTNHISNLEEHLLGCVDSYNTIDDINGIYKLLQPIKNKLELIIITNDYHVLRASVIAKNIIHSNLIDVRFLSVTSLKDISLLTNRLKHEFTRIQEYLD